MTAGLCRVCMLRMNNCPKEIKSEAESMSVASILIVSLYPFLVGSLSFFLFLSCYISLLLYFSLLFIFLLGLFLVLTLCLSFYFQSAFCAHSLSNSLLLIFALIHFTFFSSEIDCYSLSLFLSLPRFTFLSAVAFPSQARPECSPSHSAHCTHQMPSGLYLSIPQPAAPHVTSKLAFDL